MTAVPGAEDLDEVFDARMVLEELYRLLERVSRKRVVVKIDERVSGDVRARIVAAGQHVVILAHDTSVARLMRILGDASDAQHKICEVRLGIHQMGAWIIKLSPVTFFVSPATEFGRLKLKKEFGDEAGNIVLHDVDDIRNELTDSLAFLAGIVVTTYMTGSQSGSVGLGFFSSRGTTDEKAARSLPEKKQIKIKNSGGISAASCDLCGRAMQVIEKPADRKQTLLVTSRREAGRAIAQHVLRCIDCGRLVCGLCAVLVEGEFAGRRAVALECPVCGSPLDAMTPEH